MEPDQPAPFFKVQRVETTLVKPLQPTPSNTLSFSTLDNDLNLEFISKTLYIYKAKDSLVHDSHSRQLDDPAYLIQEALSKLLVHYYPLAGKLKRHQDKRLRLNCTGEGVPFVVAKADCTLSSLNYFSIIDINTSKDFIYEEFDVNGTDESHPLMMQVTKFACGGFTIGLGMSHSVFDGFGAAQFFRALTELASGEVEPLVKPVWERERLIVGTDFKEPIVEIPLGEVSLAKTPYLPSKELLHECFNVDSESIKRLKIGLMKERESCGDQDLGESFTTLEVLSAFVWRSRFRALKLNLDGKTLLSFTVGIRKLLDPPLPDGYYGNAFVASQVVLVGKDLCESPLSRVVKMIKESKKMAFKSEYIWSWLGFLEKANQDGVKIDQSNGATIMLTDWRQLGLLEQVDFGWKEAVNMIPVPWNVLGYVDLCIFLPPSNLDPSMRGGVRVLVCLPTAAMTKFNEEMAALKLEDFKL
ncbi:Transferase [Macleaya cordata]|uniref:Transferase n=1 Tax=Macleaya cordata TaxID=56857 RepID=A0A200QQD4_MACCD|nr:Transferase [Macleaya cordata]